MQGVIPLILHERQANWARQLRPRVATWPVKLHESRSGEELTRLVSHRLAPLLLVDLGDRPCRVLEELEKALQHSPGAISLVIDPAGDRRVLTMARELGATLAMGGTVLPPVVVGLLERWVRLARRRLENEGWCEEQARRVEPWDGLLQPA